MGEGEGTARSFASGHRVCSDFSALKLLLPEKDLRQCHTLSVDALLEALVLEAALLNDNPGSACQYQRDVKVALSVPTCGSEEDKSSLWCE